MVRKEKSKDVKEFNYMHYILWSQNLIRSQQVKTAPVGWAWGGGGGTYTYTCLMTITKY